MKQHFFAVKFVAKIHFFAVKNKFFAHFFAFGAKKAVFTFLSKKTLNSHSNSDLYFSCVISQHFHMRFCVFFNYDFAELQAFSDKNQIFFEEIHFNYPMQLFLSNRNAPFILSCSSFKILYFFAICRHFETTSMVC